MRTSLIVALAWLLAPAGQFGLAWAEEFKPALAKLVEAVDEQFDLTLLLAGKDADRFERARSLREGLGPLDKLHPLEDHQQLVSWLAVAVMVESAVAGQALPPEAWVLELASLYRQLAGAEASFTGLRGLARLLAIQHGDGVAPLTQFAEQLAAVPAHCRAGLRWLAGRRLSGLAAGPLRRELLVGLVEVARREGDWPAMERAASELRAAGGLPEVAGWLAEALFEQGRLELGDQALGRAAADTAQAALSRARLRRSLAEARRDAQAKPRPANQARVARALQQLGEPWRIREAFGTARVQALAQPELDEVLLDTLLDDGFDFRAAWAFASSARGQPPTAGFTARRIGAGLAMLLSGLLAEPGKPRLDPAITSLVQRDLIAFGRSDARLAELTGITLVFLEALAGKDIEVLARELSPRVKAFGRAYPGDLAGAQLGYLLGQLDPQAPTPWSVVQRYRRARAGQPEAEEFVGLYAAAAIRQALADRRSEPLGEVLGYLEGRKGLERDPGLLLWRAHLLTVRALLAAEPAQSGQLQRAVDAYGQVLRRWAESPPAEVDPQVLCTASASLATLVMQARVVEQARGLLAQVQPVCGQEPDWQAVAAVVDLVADQPPAEGQPQPVERLGQAAPALSSRAAEMQARLWLALAAEAAGQSAQAEEQFGQAAELLAAERRRGAPVVLAPDLRSLVSLSGQFDLGTAAAPGTQFGLAINVGVRPRVLLFPPAAISPDRMDNYLKKLSKPK